MAHQNLQPPPPPPVPNIRGGPDGGAPFVTLNHGGPNNRNGPPPLPPGVQIPRCVGPGPGPGHGHQSGGPPPLPPQPQHIVHNSIQYSDITPRKPHTEEDCRKKLTTYAMYTVRKQPEIKKDTLGTWAKAQFIRESLAQDDIAKQVKHLNEKTKPVAEKKAKLFPFQQQQVTKLLDSQISQETDDNFEWSLGQLDREEKINKQGKRETTVISVYLKRAPLRDLSAVALFTAIDRMNKKRAEELMRPPPPPPQQPQPVAQPVNGEHGGAAGGIVRLGSRRGGRGRGRRDDSSDSESWDSDDSRTSFGSSTQTTISSNSTRGHRRRSPQGRLGRSYSRHREPRQHRITYGRIDSPERTPPPHQPQPHVPEAPRAPVMAAIPAIDPVAAAYQAGRVDAESERYGLADRYPAERRYSPDRYVDPRLQPRAVVTYVAPPPRFEERFVEDPRPMREEYGRYAPRTRGDEYYRARERGAEDYIEIVRRPRREEYYDEPLRVRDLPYRDSYRSRYPPSDSWAA